jgi:hypothetical protein
MEGLEKYFDFPHGLPSHDTYQRLWDALSPTYFKACFTEFVGSLEKVASEVIPLMPWDVSVTFVAKLLAKRVITLFL